jgi:hypothetical protein
MRRVISVVLFILGGWILASEGMMAAMNFGMGFGAQLVFMGIVSAFAAPFLLLGLWVSPGNRFADLGVTIMIAAGVGAVLALMLVTVMSDPNFKQLMPPDRPMPNLHFSYLYGLMNLLIVGGLGLASWLFGRARVKDVEPDLERVFGDR